MWWATQPYRVQDVIQSVQYVVEVVILDGLESRAPSVCVKRGDGIRRDRQN